MLAFIMVVFLPGSNILKRKIGISVQLKEKQNYKAIFFDLSGD